MWLSAKAQQNVVGASLAYQGVYFHVEGEIEDHHGVSELEGAALGGMYQRGERFLLVCDVDDGLKRWVTIYAQGVAETRRLHELVDSRRKVTVVVRVVCTEKRGEDLWVTDWREPEAELRNVLVGGAAKFPGFESFWAPRAKRPSWVFLVGEVIDGEMNEEGGERRVGKGANVFAAEWVGGLGGADVKRNGKRSGDGKGSGAGDVGGVTGKGEGKAERVTSKGEGSKKGETRSTSVTAAGMGNVKSERERGKGLRK